MSLGHPDALPGPVSDWVAGHARRVADGGPVLDLACGAGRHTRLMLDRGHPVTAVDIDVSGLSDIEGRPGLTILEADLEGAPWPLAGHGFAGVIVTNYLWRPILTDIVAGVASGGVLIYDTFAVGKERFGKPSNPDFLLRPGELLEAVQGALTVLAYEHGEVQAPKPAVRQRICAHRD